MVRVLGAQSTVLTGTRALSWDTKLSRAVNYPVPPPRVQNFTCKAPTTDPAKVAQVLAEPRNSGLQPKLAEMSLNFPPASPTS